MPEADHSEELGFSDLDAMQNIVAQMQQMMAELQKEVDKEAVIVVAMQNNRQTWKEQNPSHFPENAASTIRSYQQYVPYLQAVLDVDPKLGRILRASCDLQPGDLFLVEDVLVDAPDAVMEPYRPVLGFYTGAWGVIHAMSMLKPHQEALISDMVNAHHDKREAWAMLVQGFRNRGLMVPPHKTDQDIAGLIGIIHSNAFQYKDEQGQTWRGLFPLAAMLSHSCQPNVAYVVEDHRLFFHAIRPVARGQELVQSYVQSFTPAHRRQRILWETFGFVCQCEVCAPQG